MAHRDCGSGLVNLDLFVHLIYVASLSFHQKLLLLNHENGNDLFMEPRAKLANFQLQDKAGESHYSKITKAYQVRYFEILEASGDINPYVSSYLEPCPSLVKKSTIGLGYFSVRLIFTARARLPERYYNGYYWL